MSCGISDDIEDLGEDTVIPSTSVYQLNNDNHVKIKRTKPMIIAPDAVAENPSVDSFVPGMYFV